MAILETGRRHARSLPASLRASLSGADLQGVQLQDTNLRSAQLQATNFQAARLRGADLRDTNLRNADFRHSDLQNVDFRGSDLQGANFRFSDLRTAYLRNVNLRDADLQNADLRDANLWYANLGDANLGGAKLQGATLRNSSIAGASLVGARLSDTDLTNADLRDADFRDAELQGAIFTDAKLGQTVLDRVDLRDVVDLEKTHHSRPSPVSSESLRRNHGRIPESFLKSCGLADWEILAARLHDPDLRQDEVADLLYEIDRVRGESPIVPLSVFISYNRDDQRFVEKLENRLNKDRVRSWRDLKDMKAGPWEEQVDRAIGLQKTVILVLSEESIRSKWVLAEVERAQEVREELEKRSDGPVHVLCPVALDDAWKDDRTWPRVLRMEIQRYNILDFSRWGSDEEFEKEYEKLKTGLGIYYAKDVPDSGADATLK